MNTMHQPELDSELLSECLWAKTPREYRLMEEDGEVINIQKLESPIIVWTWENLQKIEYLNVQWLAPRDTINTSKYPVLEDIICTIWNLEKYLYYLQFDDKWLSTIKANAKRVLEGQNSKKDQIKNDINSKNSQIEALNLAINSNNSEDAMKQLNIKGLLEADWSIKDKKTHTDQISALETEVLQLTKDQNIQKERLEALTEGYRQLCELEIISFNAPEEINKTIEILDYFNSVSSNKTLKDSIIAFTTLLNNSDATKTTIEVPEVPEPKVEKIKKATNSLYETIEAMVSILEKDWYIELREINNTDKVIKGLKDIMEVLRDAENEIESKNASFDPRIISKEIAYLENSIKSNHILSFIKSKIHEYLWKENVRIRDSQDEKFIFNAKVQDNIKAIDSNIGVLVENYNLFITKASALANRANEINAKIVWKSKANLQISGIKDMIDFMWLVSKEKQQEFINELVQESNRLESMTEKRKDHNSAMVISKDASENETLKSIHKITRWKGLPIETLTKWISTAVLAVIVGLGYQSYENSELQDELAKAEENNSKLLAENRTLTQKNMLAKTLLDEKQAEQYANFTGDEDTLQKSINGLNEINSRSWNTAIGIAGGSSLNKVEVFPISELLGKFIIEGEIDKDLFAEIKLDLLHSISSRLNLTINQVKVTLTSNGKFYYAPDFSNSEIEKAVKALLKEEKAPSELLELLKQS